MTRPSSSADMRNEHGTVAVTVVVMAITVLLAGGLVIDGGRIMAARREAASVASSAARTAAQELNVDLFETNDHVTILPTDADTVARKLLVDQGYDDFEITVIGDTVLVVVRDEVRLTILSMLGPQTRRVVGTATATLTQQ
jgi:Flp pilus assembly protein TadG